ncbi:hypothetical protein JTE90_002864 [Oedothorax gibbosus]|uniref:Whirlin n=1 Tax=Oedothorax gibbosus TaxID=931172 RepID=A0AAV6TUU4_9ARAC|nr:hypothetical protein JTE90_002864 [Oedothorax gibbosus]
MTHDEAVNLLQTSPRMSMVVKGEGRVPCSTLPLYGSPEEPLPSTSAAADGWYGDSMTHRKQLSRKGSPRKRDHLDEGISSNTSPNQADRRLDRKARKLLTEGERLTLAYYCNEYETGAMNVADLVANLFEQLIDTQEKFSLMSDIRALVPSEDIGKFDELIYRREMQALKSNETMKLPVEIHTEHADSRVSPPAEILRNLSPRNTFRASTRRRQQQQDKHHLTVPEHHDHPDDLHTPSEDSGVDLPNGAIFGHGSRKGSRVSTGSRDSITLDTKALQQQHQRKSSPCRLWRTSPRTSRRSLDAMTTTNQATRVRRATFRRHSSGGEGGMEETRRRPRFLSHDDRRWSIGSEMGDNQPYGVEGHLTSWQRLTNQ